MIKGLICTHSNHYYRGIPLIGQECVCGKLRFCGFKKGNTFMTFQQFDEYQEALLKEVVVMKTTKGKEYANSEDRFANFNRLAPRLGISNLAVCLVYLTKHMDAIESYCKNQRVYSTESIQGRIVDAITYLTLLGGMIKQNDDDEAYRKA